MRAMKRLLPWLLSAAYLLVACDAGRTTATPPPTATPVPPALGAGFRYSTYGPREDPGPEYWVSVGQRMAAKFAGARPQAIWIVGNYGGDGTTWLSFPGEHSDSHILFSPTDDNEAALKRFDEAGVQVWLQVEPGDAPVTDLIELMLARYGSHPCVIGVGVDVEWFHSDGTPEGRAVTDEEAAAWVAAARAFNPRYRLFLKHWEQEKMPPAYRDGVLFVDDSQQFESFDAMVDEFSAWGRAFAPTPVGFQFGYAADRDWWGTLADPAGEIGRAILARVPNTQALYWVDFTILEVFPESGG